MPPTMSKSKRSRGFVRPSSPSSYFQEALRMCHDEEEEDLWTEKDGITLDGHTANGGDSSNDSGLTNSDSPSPRHDLDLQPPTPPLGRRYSSPSLVLRGYNRSRLAGADGSVFGSVAGSKQSSHPSEDLFPVSEDSPRSDSPSDNPSAGCETTWPPSTKRRLSLPLLEKGLSREATRVQWADDLQQQLVRERPRKRYERKPSLPGAELPKPILKNSSGSSGSLNDRTASTGDDPC